MQSDNRLMADFVKLANAAAGTIAGMTREARESARERMKERMGGFDFVSREEFEVVKALAANARGEVDRLAARVAALEGAAQAGADTGLGRSDDNDAAPRNQPAEDGPPLDN